MSKANKNKPKKATSAASAGSGGSAVPVEVVDEVGASVLFRGRHSAVANEGDVPITPDKVLLSSTDMKALQVKSGGSVVLTMASGARQQLQAWASKNTQRGYCVLHRLWTAAVEERDPTTTATTYVTRSVTRLAAESSKRAVMVSCVHADTAPASLCARVRVLVPSVPPGGAGDTGSGSAHAADATDAVRVCEDPAFRAVLSASLAGVHLGAAGATVTAHWRGSSLAVRAVPVSVPVPVLRRHSEMGQEESQGREEGNGRMFVVTPSTAVEVSLVGEDSTGADAGAHSTCDDAFGGYEKQRALALCVLNKALRREEGGGTARHSKATGTVTGSGTGSGSDDSTPHLSSSSISSSSSSSSSSSGGLLPPRGLLLHGPHGTGKVTHVHAHGHTFSSINTRHPHSALPSRAWLTGWRAKQTWKCCAWTRGCYVPSSRATRRAVCWTCSGARGRAAGRVAGAAWYCWRTATESSPPVKTPAIYRSVWSRRC